MLKDMGFEQTTPREVQQSQAAEKLRQSIDEALQSSGLTPGPPLVPAAAQRQQEGAVHRSSGGDSDSAHTAPQQGTEQLPADAVADAGRQRAELPPALQPAGSPAASASEPADGGIGLRACDCAQQKMQGIQAAPAVRPDLLAAVAEGGAPQAATQPPLPPPQPLQPPLPPPQEPPQRQEQRSWRRWSESSARDVTRRQADHLQPLPASPFQAPAAASLQPAALLSGPHAARQSAADAPQLRPLGAAAAVPAATASLQREDSAKLMGELALEQDAVLEGAVARRSNSGPLSRTMLRVRLHPLLEGCVTLIMVGTARCAVRAWCGYPPLVCRWSVSIGTPTHLCDPTSACAHPALGACSSTLRTSHSSCGCNAI